MKVYIKFIRGSLYKLNNESKYSVRERLNETKLLSLSNKLKIQTSQFELFELLCPRTFEINEKYSQNFTLSETEALSNKILRNSFFPRNIALKILSP